MTVTIYHNPACGTSRNTLAMIRQSGAEPVVVEYLKNPPTRARLVELLRKMGISARDLLRQRGTPYAELDLADPKWSEDELIGFMLEHPILIERPIVETPKGARLCRPAEKVLEILRGARRTPGLIVAMRTDRRRDCAGADVAVSAGGDDCVVVAGVGEQIVMIEREDI